MFGASTTIDDCSFSTEVSNEGFNGDNNRPTDSRNWTF